MLVAGFPAGWFGTNCYVAAPAAGEQCVIIDPGQDAVGGIDELVREYRLRPAAVLLTHGHIDHVWSVVPVCGAHDVAAYIHPADRALLADPTAGLDAYIGRQLLGGLTFTEPADVVEITGTTVLSIAGLELTVEPAPGHTPGSITFGVPAAGAGPDAPVLFAGDLLFAGSVGRTDLPGGDPAEMSRSLSRVCLSLPDETTVLPGHGPATTIGRERATNPFLAGLVDPTGDVPAGRR